MAGESAVECMVTMETLVGQWNIEWGPVADWHHQFTNKYVSAVGEKTTVAFIGGIAQKVQSGKVLMDDIACVISECTLPVSKETLRAFIQLLVKLTTKD